MLRVGVEGSWNVELQQLQPALRLTESCLYTVPDIVGWSSGTTDEEKRRDVKECRQTPINIYIYQFLEFYVLSFELCVLRDLVSCKFATLEPCLASTLLIRFILYGVLGGDRSISQVKDLARAVLCVEQFTAGSF